VHHDQRPRWGSSLLVSWLHGNRISSAEADSLSSSSLLCSVSESRASLLNRGINTDSTVMPPDSLQINACQPFIITSGTVVRHRVCFPMGNGEIRPSQNQNPFAGWYKIVKIWLRLGVMPQIKFCKKNLCNGGFWGDWWNTTSGLFYIPFSCHRLQVRPDDRCTQALTQKTWIHSRMCLWGLEHLNYYQISTLSQKLLKFLTKWDLTQSLENTNETMCAPCRSPLHILVQKRQIITLKMQIP